MQLFKKLRDIESFLIVSLFLILVGLSLSQLILRNFFDITVVWFDSAIRIVVLWVTFLGASATALKNEHIKLDLLKNIIKNKFIVSLLAAVAYLFTFLLCLLVTYYSVVLIYDEYIYETIAFAEVPTWICMLVLPNVFTIMSIRYCIKFSQSIFGKQT